MVSQDFSADGWITILMRVVDVVYCIPAIPLYLILGSIMDYYKASAKTRIYMLCIVMSIIGWGQHCPYYPRTDLVPARAGVHDGGRGNRYPR